MQISLHSIAEYNSKLWAFQGAPLPLLYLVDALVFGQFVLLCPVIQSTLMEGVNFHALHQNESTEVATSRKRIKARGHKPQ